MSITSFFRDVLTGHAHSHHETEVRNRYRGAIHDFKNQQFLSVGQARQAQRVAENAESQLNETIKTQETSKAGLHRIEQQFVRRLQGNT